MSFYFLVEPPFHATLCLPVILLPLTSHIICPSLTQENQYFILAFHHVWQGLLIHPLLLLSFFDTVPPSLLLLIVVYCPSLLSI